jgi:hypothetical protein
MSSRAVKPAKAIDPYTEESIEEIARTKAGKKPSRWQ